MNRVYENFEQLLAAEGQYVTQIHGVSMFPMLRNHKDPILIVPITKELSRYDVAVYFRGDNYVVHRVLQVDRDKYIIRGDNCSSKEYVPKELVRGVVAGFWKGKRFVPVSNNLYRAYSRLWVAINPVIRFGHRLDRMAKRTVSFIKS